MSGSLVDYLFSPGRPGEVLPVMTEPSTGLVSLTITEGGYHVNQATGDFDADDPDVQHNLMSGAVPKSAFGFLTEALAGPRVAGVAPSTVMSCDSVPNNGVVTHPMLCAVADPKDAQLAAWIAKPVSFPGSIVDRITPVTADADRADVAHGFRVENDWLVAGVPWAHWVLADHVGTAGTRWSRSAHRSSKTWTPMN